MIRGSISSLMQLGSWISSRRVMFADSLSDIRGQDDVLDIIPIHRSDVLLIEISLLFKKIRHPCSFRPRRKHVPTRAPLFTLVVRDIHVLTRSLDGWYTSRSLPLPINMLMKQ